MTRVSPEQKKQLIRWLIAGATVMIALAIAASLTDARRFFNGMLAGAVFVTPLGVGACIYVILQARSSKPEGVVLRRPLEWIAGSLSYCALAYGILIVGQNRTWPMAGILAAFTARASVYALLWVGFGTLVLKAGTEADDGKRKKLDRLGKRPVRLISILVATVVLMALEWIVGLHREPAAMWLGPIFAANLLAGGIASAVAVGALVVARIEQLGFIGADAARSGNTARWLALSSLAWLITAGGVVAAIYWAPHDVRAQWQPHATLGVWRMWSIADLALHVVPLIVLVTRSRGALVLAAITTVLAQLATAGQLVSPAIRGDALPTWIELGGVAAFLVGVWLMLFQSASERPLYPDA